MGLSVAGCATAVAPAEPLPRPAPAKASTPTPVVPARLPALEDLVITPGGIGSLRIGQPVSGTDMIVFDPNYCGPEEGEEPGYYPDGAPIEYGRWVPNYPGETPLDVPFNAHANEGIVSAIEVRTDTLSTAEGVRVGSSLGALTSAYPSLVAGDNGHASRSLLHFTTEGVMVFEVTTAGVELYDRYAPDVVYSIRIFPAGAANPGIVFATDNYIGGCI